MPPRHAPCKCHDATTTMPTLEEEIAQHLQEALASGELKGCEYFGKPLPEVDVDAGRVIDHQAVQAWADSLGTEKPLPPPSA